MTSQYLMIDGSGHVSAGPGSSVPGGASGQLQYNNAGALGGFTMAGDATVNASTGLLTLATVNANVGTFGDGTHVPQVTVNAKGLITAISSVVINVLAALGFTPVNKAGDTMTGSLTVINSLVVNSANGGVTFNSSQNTVTRVLNFNNATGSAQASYQVQTGTTNCYSILNLNENGGSPYDQWSAGPAVLNRFYNNPNHYFQGTTGTTFALINSAGLTVSVGTVKTPNVTTTVTAGSGTPTVDASQQTVLSLAANSNGVVMSSGGYALLVVAEVLYTGQNAVYMVGNGGTNMIFSTGQWVAPTTTPGANQYSIIYDATTSAYRLYTGSAAGGFRFMILRAG